MAILPSPVFAALPSYNSGTNSGSFTVTNGSVTTTTGTGVIQSSDRAVLVWSAGQFNIASGETFNFQVPGGSVLNKVGYASGADTATIAGTLISSGKVFVLANGNIIVNGSANISTQGGLVLSTLAETSDFNYTTTGNLALTGAPQGNVTLGNGAPQLFVSNGGLSAYANNVSVNNIKVTGDLLVANRGVNQGLTLTGATVTVNNVTTVGTTEVTGNLNASTNNGSITQTGSNTALMVSGTTMLNTGGNASISLLSSVTVNSVTTTLNDFGTVMVTTGSAASVSLDDKNSIVLGSSSLGSLTVNAVNNITTSGAVAAASSVTLTSRDTTANTNKVDFGSGSSVGGTFSANVANGTITTNTVGNLTTGLVTTGGGALLSNLTITSGGSGYTAQPTVVVSGGGGTGAVATASINTSTGVVTGVNFSNLGSGYTSAPTVSFVGGGNNPSTAATATVQIAQPLATPVAGTINTTLAGGAGYDIAFLPFVRITDGTTTELVQGNWNTTSGTLIGVTILTGLTTYTSAPRIVLDGVAGVNYPMPVVQIGGNTGSIPNVAVGPGVLNASTLTGGSGYTVAPTVTFSGGGGTGAVVTVPAPNTSGSYSSAALGVSIAGTGYTSAPTALITGGGIQPTTVAPAVSAQSSPTGGNVSITTTGILTVNGNVNGGNVTVTAPSIVGTSGGAVAAKGSVTYNATGGNLVVGTTTAGKIGLTAAGGSITQNGSLSHIVGTIATGPTAVTTVVNAGSTGDITLNGANNLVGIVQLNGRDVAVTNSGLITLGLTTTAGNLSATTTTSGAGIAFGTGQGTATQNVTVGNSLNLTTNNGAVTDDSYTNQYVFGNTTINTFGGAVTLNAAAQSSNGATGRFGQFNVNSGGGAVILSENTAINLGNVTAGGGALTVRSMNSDVIINGNVTAGATKLRANGNISQAATSTLVLSGSHEFETVDTAGIGTSLTTGTNSFTGGTVRIINGGENNIVSGSSITVNLANITSGNVKVSTVNAGTGVITVGVTGGNGGRATNATIVSADAVVINGGTYRNLTVSAATSITQGANMFTVNDTLSLTTPGTVNIAVGSANISKVVLNNVVGNSTIWSSRDMTVSGMSAGVVDVGAGMGSGSNTSFVGPWSLTLGNLNVGNLTARASNHGGNVTTNGTSGTIKQAAGSSIHVERDTMFSTYQNDIIIANNGNSAGKLSASTNGAGNITYIEDSAARIGNIATNGTLTLTSRFGSILEDQTDNVNVSAVGLVTLNAPNGSVALGNSTHTAGVTTGDIRAVTINASGAAQVISTNNVTLGGVNANSLLVTSGNLISQNAPVRVYGTAVLNGAGGILLTDAGNNFGPITANVSGANKNISIVEGGTLNLRAVNMPGSGNGTFTANSVAGDIIDTGLAGVKMGGNATNTGTGLVTLTAAGNIMIDDPTSDFFSTAGIAFNGKDVTLSVLGNNSTALILGVAGVSSSASGNLTASNALGSIANAGAFTVGGRAYFQAANAAVGSGNIVINQPGVGFGTLQFIGQQVNIAESGNMDILTGSSSTGIAQLNSGGAISVVDVGGTVTFGSTSTFLASGPITLTKIQAQNTITVNSAGQKDMSSLSLAGNLNSKNPVDLGTGAGPSTNPALAPKP